MDTALSLSKTLLTAGTTVAAAGLLGLYNFQLYLVYPSSLNNARTIVDTPDAYNLPSEESYLTTVDGERLHAYTLRHDPQSPSYTHKTVVMLSPNAGNIGNYLPIAGLFYSQGHNVFIYSYRGYGKSTGTASEEGLKRDADAAIQHLRADPQMSRSAIVLYGRSLGGAVAVYIASEYPLMVAGVVLENTFLSLPKVIPYIFPFLRPVAFMCNQHWRSEELIGTIPPSIPFLFLNGMRDEIVPPDHMVELYGLCVADRKYLHRFVNGSHNDTLAQPEYWEFVHEFVQAEVEPSHKEKDSV